jgi:hypothetical protein
MHTTQLTRMDKITVTQMATALREGFTTEDELKPMFGADAVKRLGTFAVEEARKAATAH